MDSILNPANYSFNIYAVFPLIASVFVFFLSFLVLSKNPKSLTHITYFIFNLTIGHYQITESLLFFSNNIKTADFLLKNICFQSITLLAINAYLFSAVMLNKLKEQRRIIISGYIISFIFYLLVVFTDLIISGTHKTQWGYYATAGRYGFLLILAFTIFSFLAIRNFYNAFKKAETSAKKNQMKYLIISLAIGLLSSSGFLPWYGIDVYTFEFLPITIYSAIVAYAIIRHQFLDIKTVFHKTAMWLTVSAIIIAPLYLSMKILHIWEHLLSIETTTIIHLGLFYLFYLYVKKVQPYIDHLFQRRKYNLLKVIDDFVKESAKLKGIEELSRFTCDTIKETLYAEDIFLLYLNEKRTKYISMQQINRSVGQLLNQLMNVESVAIDAGDPFLIELEGYNNVVERKGMLIIPNLASVRTEAESFFAKFRAELCVPIIFQNQLLAVITIGRKKNLKPFDRQDIEMLERLKLELAVIMSNSMMYDNIIKLNKELMGFNEALDSEVKKRTAELWDAYKKLQEQNILIKEADRLKSEFLTNMSHELRTPLNSVIGFSEILLDAGGIDAKGKKYISNIHTSGRHLLEIINEILDFSKIEAGRMTTNFEDFSVKELFDETVSVMSHAILKKRLNISIDIDKEVASIVSDRTKVKQIIYNLLANAVKFMPEEGAVTIQAKRTSLQGEAEAISDNPPSSPFIKGGERGITDADYIQISVKDTGIGIAKKDHDKIFRPFEQVDGSLSRNYEGTGLGLALTKRLVEFLGGRIWFESESGMGSIFYFILPDKAAAAEAKDANIVSLDMSHLVQGVVSMFEAEAREKDVSINLEIKGEDAKTVSADKEVFRGIIINLINNAVRYSKKGEDVRVLLYDDEKGYIFQTENTDRALHISTASVLFSTGEREGMGESTPHPNYKPVSLAQSRDILKAYNGWIKMERSGKGKFVVKVFMPR